MTSFVYAQELTFNLSDTYTNQFGLNSDSVGFIPLFKLDFDSIHNKQYSAKIKELPKTINTSKTAYGFLYFKGLKNSMFDKELTLLIENYESNNPIIFVDRNGNLDFTDDGKPIKLIDKLTLKLGNSENSSAVYHYQISKSRIIEKYESKFRSRFAPMFPKSTIVSAVNWLTTKRFSVRMSKDIISDNTITIFLLDNSVDGLFTFQPDDYGDRILIIEGIVDENEDLTSLFRQAEPIDHNAVFELYGKKYYIKNASNTGETITIAKTSKNTRVMFKEGQDISSFTIKLLDGTSVMIKDLIKEKKYLIIDVGGTWCGGCIAQEPTIKKIYESGKAEVIGLFDHDTPKSVTKYVKKHDLKWPVALVDSTFKGMFRVISYPTYILVSPESKIVLADMNSEQIAKYLKNK